MRQVGSTTYKLDYLSVVDYSTPLILLNAQATKDYYKQVEGASNATGVYEFPCTTILPDLTFVINGT